LVPETNLGPDRLVLLGDPRGGFVIDWLLSAAWDGLVLCLLSAGFLVLIFIGIGWEQLAESRRRRRDTVRWEQVLQARRELAIDELHMAESVEPVRVFKSTPEAVAKAEWD
jgi:hypothetical protein